MDQSRSRRRFLTAGVAAAAGLAVPSRAGADQPKKPADVNATEDLMREHGVLRRVLLVYDEAVRRLGAGEAPAEAISGGANIIRRFIEGYHERLEEELVFPRLKSGKLAPMVQVLIAQHEAGRRLTAQILADANAKALSSAPQRQALAEKLQGFARMYRPHAAREDTELFPAFHALFTEKQFDELGEQFEAQEHKLLGSGGFEGAVKEVAELEQRLAIHDLARFTPA